MERIPTRETYSIGDDPAGKEKSIPIEGENTLKLAFTGCRSTKKSSKSFIFGIRIISISFFGMEKEEGEEGGETPYSHSGTLYVPRLNERRFESSISSSIETGLFSGLPYIRGDPRTEFLVQFADTMDVYKTTLGALMNMHSLIEQCKVAMELTSEDGLPLKIYVPNVPHTSFARFLQFYKVVEYHLPDAELAKQIITWERSCYGPRSALPRSWNVIQDDLRYASELLAIDLVYYYASLLRILVKPFTKSSLFTYNQFS